MHSAAHSRPPTVYYSASNPHALVNAAHCCAQFCRKHSAMARRLRFLRKVPALRGVPDAALQAAAASAAEQDFAVRRRRMHHTKKVTLCLGWAAC